LNRKQKEALVIALSEKGKTYREITKEAGVSPNTIKAILNKAGLDQNTSISSRAFELFSEGKTPLQVAIALNQEAEEAIRYHRQYLMLLGCTEFTRVYPQIKDNPWPYVNLVKLAQNSGISEGEVTELLEISKGHLPRVRLEYDRVNEEISSHKAELNSWRAELNNIARTYQQFVDRNIELKRREDELLLSVGELEARERELQKTTTELEQRLSGLRENNACNDNLNLKVKQEEAIHMNDVFIPPSSMEFDYRRPNGNFYASQYSRSS
jgi:predicted transcriptional regulator